MNWGGPGALVFNIVVSYCCKRKMLKRNWNWRNNRRFWWNFDWGGQAPCSTLGAPSEGNKKDVRNFYARFPAFSNEISIVQKIVLSSSRGQGNFRGLEVSRPRLRTSNCVLEDSTYDNIIPKINRYTAQQLTTKKKCNQFGNAVIWFSDGS